MRCCVVWCRMQRRVRCVRLCPIMQSLYLEPYFRHREPAEFSCMWCVRARPSVCALCKSKTLHESNRRWTQRLAYVGATSRVAMQSAHWAPADLERYVRLDRALGCTARFFVSNELTGERISLVLGAGAWELGFEEDGVGFCFSIDGEEEPLVFSDLLERSVWQRPKGDGEGVELGVKTPTSSGPVPLASMMAARRLEELVLRVGPARADTVFRVTNYVLPRQGCHLFWHFASVYKSLGMSQYGGRSYVWLNHQWARFYNLLERGQWLAKKHLLMCPSGAAADQFVQDQADCRCGSTTALVVLLASWAWAKEAHGGLKCKATRASARDLLEALFECVVDEEPWVLHLAVEVQGLNPWPRPFVAVPRAEILSFDVDTRGMVALAALLPSVGRERSPQAVMLFDSLDLTDVVDNSTPLTSFMRALWQHGKLPLWRQAVCSFTERIDSRLSGRTECFSDRLVSCCEQGELTEAGLQRAIAEYIQQGRQAIARSWSTWPMISATCDESNVRGHTLYSTAVICPDNTGFWCPPQVAGIY